MPKPFTAIQTFSAKRLLTGFCLASFLFLADSFWLRESSGLRPLYAAFFFLLALVDLFVAVTASLFLYLLYLPFLAISITRRPFWQSVDIFFFLLFLLGAMVLAHAYGQTLRFHAYLKDLRLHILRAFAREETPPFSFLEDSFSIDSLLFFSLLKNWNYSGWGHLGRLKRTLREREEMELPNRISLYHLRFRGEEGVLQSTSPSFPKEPLRDIATLVQTQLDLVAERDEAEKQQGVLSELLSWLPYPVFVLYEEQVLYSNQSGLLLLRDKQFVGRLRSVIGKDLQAAFVQDKQLWRVTLADDILPLLPPPHCVVVCQDESHSRAIEANRFFFWYLRHIRLKLKDLMKKYQEQSLSISFLTSYTYTTLTFLDFLKVSQEESLALQPRLCNQAIIEQQLRRLSSFFGCSLCLKGEIEGSFVMDTPRFLSLVNLMLSLEAGTIEIEFNERACILLLSKKSRSYAETISAYTVEDMIGIYISLLQGVRRGEEVEFPIDSAGSLRKNIWRSVEGNI